DFQVQGVVSICAEGGEREIGTQGNREWITARVSAPRIVERNVGARDSLAPRRFLREPIAEQRLRHIVEDAPGGAYRHFAVTLRIPGKAESRRKILPTCVGRPLAGGESGISWKEKAGRAIYVHSGVHARGE